jgi:hypothetical protein
LRGREEANPALRPERRHRLLLHFPVADDIAADVRTFAVDENACCSFWGFGVETTSDEITLQWDAPPTAQALVV